MQASSKGCFSDLAICLVWSMAPWRYGTTYLWSDMSTWINIYIYIYIFIYTHIGWSLREWYPKSDILLYNCFPNYTSQGLIAPQFKSVTDKVGESAKLVSHDLVGFHPGVIPINCHIRWASSPHQNRTRFSDDITSFFWYHHFPLLFGLPNPRVQPQWTSFFTRVELGLAPLISVGLLALEQLAWAENLRVPWISWHGTK